MKYFIAVILVVIAVASAEPPSRDRGFLARQTQQQAYQSRGIRPAGPQFNYALRSQRQQLPPIPAASYGPPAQEYGPPSEPTTTELPTTTETVETTTLEAQAENSRLFSTKEKLTNAAENQKAQSVNPASLYVVVPQTQNLFYTQSANLVSAPFQQQRLLPIQAVPAFAKIQEVPQFAQLVDLANLATVSAVPVASSAYTSFVNTPYSSSFVQSFQ
ncbi:uncharacterized protein LOC126735345 [Anthonomus grandis grandis]|uniref:uncharacterized protein LOC126735345 n=1 Tax=Anthonomus grandis grandis TaxID=2921223 RepID=UPI002165E5CF|nr:uncharacterized protein LOC126735345 [Anthonomus grandis grandis]